MTACVCSHARHHHLNDGRCNLVAVCGCECFWDGEPGTPGTVPVDEYRGIYGVGHNWDAAGSPESPVELPRVNGTTAPISTLTEAYRASSAPLNDNDATEKGQLQ